MKHDQVHVCLAKLVPRRKGLFGTIDESQVDDLRAKIFQLSCDLLCGSNQLFP